LHLSFGHFPLLPEEPFAFLWENRALPPPCAFQGRWGLLALERQEQQRITLPLNFQEDWQNQIRHLLHQNRDNHSENLPKIFLFQDALRSSTFEVSDTVVNHSEEEYHQTMSMRPDVDRLKIEQFLTELGRRFRQSGRLYLVGGAALVHAGIRPGISPVTQDIDVEIASGDMYQIIGQIKQQLNLNVEFASPGDFIPLPKNWQQFSRFVARYGKVDVFYFDFTSIALSKIDRSSARDIQDVILLIQSNTITLQQLDQAAQEIAAQMGKGAYKRLDSQAFLGRYQVIRPLLLQTP
jgi:hypothetical protein